MATLTVPARFNGPATSGNGGWTCGAVVEAATGLGLSGPVSVSLKAPPPLDRDLDLTARDDGWALLDGDDVVAQTRAGAVLTGADADPGGAVDPQRARALEPTYAGLRSHPFPTCFVCGPDREPGDGLRIFPGRLDDDRVASTWTPDSSVADHDGVGTAVTWAALDCVGGWSSDLENRPMVLAAMSAGVLPGQSPPLAGSTYVVVGRHVRAEGRKTWTASGMYDDTGALLATAQHLWIAFQDA